MLYDVIIIGSGPAGLAAGIYAGRARLNTLMIEKLMPGGQIVNTAEIENYPGQLLTGENGPSLTDRMTKQADAFGCTRVSDTVTGVDFSGDIKTVQGKKEAYQGKTVIIATGATPRPIGCDGEEAFSGKGISYCATCDGAFFRNKRVFVAGGGDSALEEALFLTRFAKTVTIVHRRQALRAARSIQEKAQAHPQIQFALGKVVDAVSGDGMVQEIRLKDVESGEITVHTATEEEGKLGLFGFVGNLPATDLFEGLITMENGYIVTDENMATSLPGVFAAGDVRVKMLRQVVTAAADGAIAAVAAEKYIENA